MRLTRLICATVLVAAAACSASLTAPPSGLPVSLSVVDAPVAHVPSITGAGDSVTAIVVETDPPCGTLPTPAAGLRGDELVVTLTQQDDRRPCPAGLRAFAPFKIVVQNVPPATRSATVVSRLVSGDHATYSRLASGAITVR